MRTYLGGTRVVILVGRYAVKIVRIRVLHALIKAVAFFISKDARRALLRRHGHAPVVAIGRSVFVGLLANRNEHRYSRRFPDDPRVMRVYGRLFWGLVIIQERGFPVSHAEFAAECPLKHPLGDVVEYIRKDQYCRRVSDDRVVLVDFGNKAATDFLLFTAK